MSRTSLLKAACALSLFVAGTAQAEILVGIDAAASTPPVRLVAFDSAAPGTLTASITLTGLPSNGPASTYKVLGLDYRPASAADPRLVLLLQGPTAVECQMYAVDKFGAATRIGTTTFNCGNPSQANFVGEIDFNPLADLIRVIGRDTTGAFNYRLNPTSAIRVSPDDSVPAYAGTDISAGMTPTISGTAYDRNVSSTAQTTLYAIDLARTPQRLVLVGGVNGSPSPNGGQLNTVNPTNATGLGITIAGDPGFDISGTSGKAYLSALVDGAASGSPPALELRFYEVELSQTSINHGVATRVGTSTIGAGSVSGLVGMTVVPASFGLSAGVITLDSGALPQSVLLVLAGFALLRRRLARRTTA